MTLPAYEVTNNQDRSKGLLRVISPDDTTKMIEDSQRKADESQADPLITSLGGHIRKVWTSSYRAREIIEERMLRCARQRQGVYEPDIRQLIDEQGGTSIFMMLTDVKCRAAESWLKDIMLPAGERPFSIDPTPIPELPPDIEQGIHDGVQRYFQMAVEQGRIAPTEMGTVAPEQVERLKKEFLQEMKEQAEDDADQMTCEVNDELTEGLWYDALSAVIEDVVSYPAGFMEGPIIRKKKCLKWQSDESGRSFPTVVEKIVREYERFSPLDAFPSPGAKTVQEGSFIRRMRYNRTDLNVMKGVPGFNEDAIDAVLYHYGEKGYRERLTYDRTREELEDRHEEDREIDGKIDCLKYWGNVQGSKLIEWGLEPEQVADPMKDYAVVAYMIGNYVISARLNSHPLGKRAIYSASFKNKNDSIWGMGVPELMYDIQHICNSTARAMVNNMAIASGPQVWALVDRLPAGYDLENIYPWKIHKFTSDRLSASEKPPIGFFQPNPIVDPLLKLYDYYFKQASEVTGIPAYVYGNENVGGAGKTAAGLSMLMNAAAKGLKAVAGHVDYGVIKPSVSEHWLHIMLNDPERARGDSKIVARASEYLVIAEQLQMRRIEYLNATANQYDAEIIPPEGRAEIHRETIKSLKMSSDKIVPDRDAIIQRTTEAKLMELVSNLAGHLGMRPEDLIAMAQQPAGKNPGPGPSNLDAAGAPAGARM